MSVSRWNTGLAVAALLFAACSDKSTPAADTLPSEAGPTVVDIKPTAGSVGAFTGDCSSSRWANVSDTCWSCFCKTCKATLNACNLDCTAGIACANANHTQVGVLGDVACEERAFAATCLTTPAAMAVTNQLVSFDECLIAAHQPPEQLRACETECNVVYPGDVCQRFPAPEGGADGG